VLPGPAHKDAARRRDGLTRVNTRRLGAPGYSSSPLPPADVLVDNVSLLAAIDSGAVQSVGSPRMRAQSMERPRRCG
jgi:hypothetical protein